MATIKAILYKSKTYKDGKHPVMIQIIHNRKVRKDSINVRLFEEEWNFNTSLPKRSVQNNKEIIRLIRMKIAEAEKTLFNIEASKNNYSINELSTKIRRQKKIISFNEKCQQIIDEMKNANRIGNAASYKTALGSLNNFTKNKQLLFTDIDYGFLKKFEDYHLGNGNTINGFNVYMRSIRAVFNRAIKEDIISTEIYPFRHYQIKQKKTIKRAISKDEMQKIVDLQLEKESLLWHTRNYFLFSFFTIGMSWIDMALLKQDNIDNNRIYYKRSKTGKEYNIKVNDKIKEILNYYIEKSNKYVFPIIKRDENETDKRKDIKNNLKLYNNRLRKIGEMINSNSKLTSYVSRHSWASIANFSGIHIGVISQGLGHEDIKTTQTYLANFDYSDIDDANDNIL